MVAAALVGWHWGLHPRPSPASTISPTSALALNPDLDPGTALPGRIAPNFTLTDQFGQSVSLSQFRGKVVVLAFADAQCTTICPLTTTSMLEAVRLLGPAASEVQLVGVNANPQATSVSDVRAYSLAHGMLHQWDFLTGSPAQLAPIWKAYGVYVAIVHGAIDHTPAVFVIDQQGRERKLYMTQMAYASLGQQAQLLATEVSHLLPNHPRVARSLSYQLIRSVRPNTPVVLPTTKTGSRTSIQLGPHHAHLVVFFATWLKQTSNLPTQLDRLNSYVQSAKAYGWPSLVAIDEAMTEPSSTALPHMLDHLPNPLAYPVALDTTGRVADGYGVKDQPWFVLTSATGRILWHHDGWLPLPILEQAVKRAIIKGVP